jgi:prepilin-type N-terminal cleavage/methylation domain-containing protein
MKLNKGFTLIELLVVIAIIGILAAIIFPVYSRVKDSAYRSSDLSNLNSIRTALQLYKVDQGGYPPAILGYATGYQNFTPGAAFPADIVPATLVANATPIFQNSAFLYPKRINSLETMKPAYDRATNLAWSSAVWPQGKYPQAFGSSTTVTRCIDFADGNGPQLKTDYFYQISGYDVASVPVPGSTTPRFELRYAPYWSIYTVPVSCSPVTYNSPTPTQNGSSSDAPGQLGYYDPPETTVITWDSFFREYDSNGNLSHNGKRDIVLFLGGSARAMDSANVALAAWQVSP